MMPISWPVSVVLAFILSVVHLAYRVSTNFNDSQPFFVQQVGDRNKTQQSA